MFISRVTITGADDSTDIDWMNEISEKYLIAEWGILVSASQMGSPRFPSMDWIIKLDSNQFQVLSLHVCGRWVREICAGDWDSFARQFGPLLPRYDRIQLNFHAYHHLLDSKFYNAARVMSEDLDWQFIFQLDGVNDALVNRARHHKIDASPLFDLSGGAGIVPDSWPVQPAGVYCGYAGGLGPDNVLNEIDKIEKVATGEIWIDMETKVRTPDNMSLDRQAVESVLEQVCNHGSHDDE